MIEPLASFANKDILVATLYSGANVHDKALLLYYIHQSLKCVTWNSFKNQ